MQRPYNYEATDILNILKDSLAMVDGKDNILYEKKPAITIVYTKPTDYYRQKVCQPLYRLLLPVTSGLLQLFNLVTSEYEERLLLLRTSMAR